MTSSLLLVVPTLNSYKLLPRLLSSVQAQSWTQWRLLFVDGPSCRQHREWLISCCNSDSRCTWVEDLSDTPSIYGAMNLGFQAAKPYDWILFWGSDDLAASPTVFSEIMAHTSASTLPPDLLVTRARYFDPITGHLSRSTLFKSAGLYSSFSYNRALFLGSTPPHQATVFGPSVWARLSHFDTRFLLTADLFYFLQLMQFPDLVVQCIDLESVHLGSDGISANKTRARLFEVYRSYLSTFRFFWFIPFFMRYLRKTLSFYF